MWLEEYKNIRVLKENNFVLIVNNSLWSLGPHIWNYLPSEMKEKTEYEKFKNYMNDWFGLKCNCNLCSFLKAKAILSSLDYDVRLNPSSM